MNKYTNKIIVDYINGNDLSNLEELENNYLFMTEVIKYTDDKKIYKLCSNEVKYNFNFVRFLINKFKDDTNFICLVTDNYLKNHKANDENKIELLILISNIIKNINIDKSIEYEFILKKIYSNDLMCIEKIKKSKKDDIKYIKQIGKGFIYIFDKYNNSKIVLDFYALEFIKEIYQEEELRKEIYKNLNNINKIGINHFLLSYINKYDEFLRDYIITNIYLLDKYKNMIIKLKEMNNYNNKNIKVLKKRN